MDITYAEAIARLDDYIHKTRGGRYPYLGTTAACNIKELLQRQQAREVVLVGALQRIAADRPLSGPLNLSDLDMQAIARTALAPDRRLKEAGVTI